jgi:hypothetical protein
LVEEEGIFKQGDGLALGHSAIYRHGKDQDGFMEEEAVLLIWDTMEHSHQ